MPNKKGGGRGGGGPNNRGGGGPGNRGGGGSGSGSRGCGRGGSANRGGGHQESLALRTAGTGGHSSGPPSGPSTATTTGPSTGPPASQATASSNGTRFNPGYAPEPVVNLKQSEDRLLASLQHDGSPNLPVRPGFGTQGSEVVLWANYFQLKANRETVLYRYSVNVLSPTNQSPPPKLAKRIVELLLSDHLGRACVSDFRSTIISRAELQLPEGGRYNVQYRAEEEDVPDANAPTFVAKVEYSGTLSMSDLLDFTTSANASSFFGGKQEIIQALNLIVGHHPKTNPNIASVGRNRHVNMQAAQHDRRELGGGVQAIRAFVFSVRAATERLLVGVQIKNMPFYRDENLLTLAYAFRNDNRTNNLHMLSIFLKGISVDVKHLARTSASGRRIPRYKTIFGLATKADGAQLPHRPIVPVYGAGAQDVQFWLGENPPSKGKGQSGPAAAAAAATADGSSGHYISVFDFFKQRYNITLTTPLVPVVNVGNTANPVYLPMEQCDVRPGQPLKGKLSPYQTKEMIKHAIRRPGANALSVVTSGLNTLGLAGNNPTLTNFDVGIVPRLITVPGRVLQPPVIQYQGQDKMQARYASWNLVKHKFLLGANLPSWTSLRISLAGGPQPRPTGPPFQDILKQFAAKLRECGVSAGDPMPGHTVQINPNNADREIFNALKKIADQAKKPGLVLILFPGANDAAATSIYNRAKFVCDVQLGLTNVCVKDENFCSKGAQYHANVGLKVNLKLGGQNHTLLPEHFCGISPAETMFVGIDVTHPSPGSLKTAPSVAAIVSSVDKNLAQWPADIRIQNEAKNEMVDSLEELLRGCLTRWRKKNANRLPNKVIVYRDGVSEGQYQLVLDNELPSLRKAIDGIYEPTERKKGVPKLAIIIAGKRHHTRFYPTNPEKADRGGNTECGTIVDRGVTEVANFDFFLQAHTALQGTAKPTHYYVIYDEIFSADKASRANAANNLQKLSHNLCYLFGRATKAVSLCPPAYYADLVCERARRYMAHFYAPTAAQLVGDAAGPAQPQANLVQVHERVRETMFYI